MSPWAVVSGATGSIGGAVARRLWAEGYSLLLLGRTPEKMMTLHDALRALPHAPDQRFQLEALNLARSAHAMRLPRLVDACAATPCLVVTCHGHAPAPTPARVAHGMATRVWNCDVRGTLLVCEVAGRAMIRHEVPGCFVLVSSIHAYATYPHRVPYSTAKAAICGMARALAVEWGQYGIRVNSLSPWQVRNERSEAIAQQEHAVYGIDTLELYRQRSPLRRLVEPDDIADAVLMVGRNSSITGQDIVIDCGVRASMWHRPFEEQCHG